MKFTRLSAFNFLTLQSANIALADRGLNVIQGVNDADSSAHSNGAGKSSIVDALCWCLFGVTARGVKGDSVVNRSAKKDAEVRVVMQHGETEYIVARYRKHREYKNSLRLLVRPAGDPGREPDDISKGTDAETQKEVERVLGCSLEVFIAAVYAGQEAMPDLPRMTDRDLKRLIEEAAGLQRIEAAYQEARQRRLTHAGKHELATNALASIRTRMARDESALLLKTTEAQAWDDARAARVSAARTAVTAAQTTLDALAEKLRSGKPEYDRLMAAIGVIDAGLADHSKIEAVARAAESALARAEAAVERQELLRAANAIKTIEEQIGNVDAEMAKPCPECGKPHDASEKATYLAHRGSALAAARLHAEQVGQRVREQIEAVKTAHTAATSARAAVPDIGDAMRLRAEHEAACKAFEGVARDARNAKSALDAARVALAARESEVNPLADTIKTLRERIEADAAAAVAAEGEIAELQRRVDIADAVVKVFGPAGVRAHILDTVTPFLNERTADYLSALSDGAITAIWSTLTKAASGDLKEKFSIEVTSATGGDSFAALSGGEKRKVRLATALALQDLVASRATQPIDLWIGDEVDDALDPAGLERLMTIMERKARERGTVLIISHNDLADWADQITTVRKKDGFSTVEGSLCS